MDVSRAGASLGIPGLYVTGDPGAVDDAAKVGQIGVRLGLGWAKSHTFVTGQCPVKQYNRQLMNLILADKAHIAKAVNATDDQPRRGGAGLRRVRQGRRTEVRHRPARHGPGLTDERCHDFADLPFSTAPSPTSTPRSPSRSTPSWTASRRRWR